MGKADLMWVLEGTHKCSCAIFKNRSVTLWPRFRTCSKVPSDNWPLSKMLALKGRWTKANNTLTQTQRTKETILLAVSRDLDQGLKTSSPKTIVRLLEHLGRWCFRTWTNCENRKSFRNRTYWKTKMNSAKSKTGVRLSSTVPMERSLTFRVTIMCK